MSKNYQIFPAYYTHSAGIWYFVPRIGTFKKGKPCKGFGAIKYGEGSVYTGDIYYDGKIFHKLGLGKQDFSYSTIGNMIEAIKEKKYLFVGQYDYRKTDWIYGNGVLYYVDEFNHPTHFIKGFFRGLDKIGDYKGVFDNSQLIAGYLPEMEFDYDENKGHLEERWNEILSKIKQSNTIKALFLGDSYFELADNIEYAGRNLLKKAFSKDYVNIGIGGSKFSDWNQWIEKIKDISCVEKIVINLGFNDLHSGKSWKSIYSDFRKLIKQIREYFPNTKILLISVIHAPNCQDFYEIENIFNEKIIKMSKRNNVDVYDWNMLIKQCEDNCFHGDAIHPNENGYGIFINFLKEILEER